MHQILKNTSKLLITQLAFVLGTWPIRLVVNAIIAGFMFPAKILTEVLMYSRNISIEEKAYLLQQHLQHAGNVIHRFIVSKTQLNQDTQNRVYLDESFNYARDVSVASNLTSNGRAKVTVVYAFRDRSTERLRFSINSLKKFVQVEFEVLVVDYGSKPEVAAELVKLATECGFKLIRSETAGQPWSRSKALNIGIVAASTEYVTTTDIDMLFEGDILQASLDVIKPKMVLHCQPWWLTQSGKREDAWLGDKFQIGGFQFAAKQDLIAAGGFNEEFYFWGAEDLEFDSRLKQLGYEISWIDGDVKMFHMWHPVSYGFADTRPQSSWMYSNLVLMQTNLGNLNNNQQEIGKVVTPAERPILDLLNQQPDLEINYIGNYANEVASIVEQATTHKFIRLNLGTRFKNVAATELIANLQPLYTSFLEQGVELLPQKNLNYDFFYLSLPLLKTKGLRDYYVSADNSQVYLLFN
jgi:hypothetical protein